MKNRKNLKEHLEKYMSDNGLLKGDIWERRELLDIMEDAHGISKESHKCKDDLIEIYERDLEDAAVKIKELEEELKNKS